MTCSVLHTPPTRVSYRDASVPRKKRRVGDEVHAASSYGSDQSLDPCRNLLMDFEVLFFV